MKTTLSQILNDKGGSVLVIDRRATVFEAIAKMAEHSVGCLVVMDGAELSR